jgi:monothiol glutaredoxin
MNEEIKSQIEAMITSHQIFLFMKGSAEMPMCGFSAQAVGLLKAHGVEFGVFNVYDDDAIRQGVKEYADWPTIPQLYVKGEFIGGADIMGELHQSGELEKILKPKSTPDN